MAEKLAHGDPVSRLPGRMGHRSSDPTDADFGEVIPFFGGLGATNITASTGSCSTATRIPGGRGR